MHNQTANPEKLRKQELAKRTMAAADCLAHAIDRRDHRQTQDLTRNGIAALLVLAASVGINGTPNPKAIIPPLSNSQSF